MGLVWIFIGDVTELWCLFNIISFITAQVAFIAAQIDYHLTVK